VVEDADVGGVYAVLIVTVGSRGGAASEGPEHGATLEDQDRIIVNKPRTGSANRGRRRRGLFYPTQSANHSSKRVHRRGTATRCACSEAAL